MQCYLRIWFGIKPVAIACALSKMTLGVRLSEGQQPGNSPLSEKKSTSRRVQSV